MPSPSRDDGCPLAPSVWDILSIKLFLTNLSTSRGFTLSIIGLDEDNWSVGSHRLQSAEDKLTAVTMNPADYA